MWLLRAIPEPDPERTVPRDLPRGEVPDAVAPPLGCSFHPRCPRAFEVCGWEPRDLRTLLEARWTRLSEPDYEAERALIADLDSLAAAGPVARVEAARGHSGQDVAGILEKLRADAPDDPFWKGVAGIEAVADAAIVRFHDYLDPRPVGAGAARVECHLYDDEALERARHAAAR